MKKEKEEYQIYRTSVAINSIQAIALYVAYLFIFFKYINFLDTLEEPILLFVGLLFFIYISLGRVISILGDIFTDNKYHVIRNKEGSKK